MKVPAAVVAEGFGTAALLAVVVGSGIMGESLASGNAAIALLANALATGAGLYVLITLLGPISGAHFNPAVTFVFWRNGERAGWEAAAYIVAQLVGAVAGVWLAHVMFGAPVLELSEKVRSGTGQWVSEIVATCGLLSTVLLGVRVAPRSVPALVGCYIGAAYWFTASTSFANPAVTIARSLTNTFAGIRPQDVPGFVAAQLAGTACVLAVLRLSRRAGAPNTP